MYDEDTLYVYSYSEFDEDYVFMETKYELKDVKKLEKENKKLRRQNKQLKQQNRFLMKQDNILQTLMQWLYKIKDKPVTLYIGSKSSKRIIEQARFQAFYEVIDKIKDLKEDLK